jgi:ribosomal protein S18 acetylase RimI-like enzyme
MNVLMRQARDADLPQILAIYAQLGIDDDQILDLVQVREIYAQFSRYPNYRLFVACDIEAQYQIRGSYALLVMHNLAHQGQSSAIVEDVVVDAAYRSPGIGRQMMEHAMAQARAARCYKLALSSNRRRELAHAFYESLGFDRHGISFVIDCQSS